MNWQRHEFPDIAMRLPWGTRMAVLLRAEYPILLAAAAAMTAAGTGLSMAGNAKANDQINDMRNAELLRQKGYQNEADTEFQDSLSKSTAPGAQEAIDSGAENRLAAYSNLRNATAGLTETPGRNQPIGTSAGGASARADANQRATNAAWSNLQGAARANLGGYSDWGLQDNIKNRRANQNLAITAGKARSSASVLPMEISDAQHAGDSLNAWGQLASALGTVAGMGAAVGLGGAAVAGSGAGGAALSQTGQDFSSAWGAALN